MNSYSDCIKKIECLNRQLYEARRIIRLFIQEPENKNKELTNIATEFICESSIIVDFYDSLQENLNCWTKRGK